MVAKKVTLQEEHGLHMRPAMHIVEKCQNYEAKVTICLNCKEADGCSIMSLLLLEAEKGSELEIKAVGSDEERALSELAELFNNGAGI